MDGDLTPLPDWAPNADGDHVGKEFQVRDAEITEFGRGGGRNELMILVVVGSDTWFSVIEAVSRGVQGNVERVVRDEERYTVTKGYRLLPPSDVSPEIVVQHDWFPVSGSPSLGGQTSVEEKSTS